MFGAADPGELIGKPAIDFVHPDDREMALKQISQLPPADATRAPLVEARFLRLDGTLMDIEVAAVPFSYVGKPAILTVFNDITERKRREETLRQRIAELEAVNRVSTSLRAAHTRDEALPILLDETLSVLGNRCWCHLGPQPRRRPTARRRARGWFGQLADMTLKPGEGIAGNVFATGNAHIAAEFTRDPQVRPPASGEIPAGWGGICLPIRAGETDRPVSCALPRDSRAKSLRNNCSC